MAAEMDAALAEGGEAGQMAIVAKLEAARGRHWGDEALLNAQSRMGKLRVTCRRKRRSPAIVPVSSGNAEKVKRRVAMLPERSRY